jgi:hypothetical protein
VQKNLFFAPRLFTVWTIHELPLLTCLPFSKEEIIQLYSLKNRQEKVNLQKFSQHSHVCFEMKFSFKIEIYDIIFN